MRHNSVVGVSLLLACAALALASPCLANAEPDLNWSTESTQPGRFLAVHGQRSAIFGYSEHGLEIWAYPIQVVDTFNVSFRQEHSTTAIDGRTVLRRIEYRPESVTRVFVGPDFVVREKLFVPIDRAGAILSYEVAGSHPIDIEVRFNPVLNLMWPAGIGGQEVLWNSAASGYLLSEPLHRYAALVSSPDIVAHDDTPNATRRVGEAPGVAFTIRASKGNPAEVVIASGQDPTAIATALLSNRDALENAAAQHYEQSLQQGLRIETPDPEVNRALAWLQLALEQTWVCNAELGCAHVAGYGPSRKARRPQYDWFFAGDGMVTARALLAAGRHERAREQLEFTLEYQDRKTGMIWHELSQSAGALEWDKYPYMFGHVDLTYDFLDMVAEYYSTTGDAAFVKEHWAALEAAYRYGRSLLDPKDGLPRIPAGKQGLNEQDELSEELTLSIGWVAASQAYATLARAVGKQSIAKTALAANRQAHRAVNDRYWDPGRNYWNSGRTRAGAPVTDRDIRAVGVVRQSLFTSAQRDAALDQIASYEFQTDWGTRGRAENDPTYDPHLYSSGSVWGIASAGVMSAFWNSHRPATALPIWSALLPWSWLDSPGHMHETLSGDVYRPGIESVPEQTWSAASFLTTTVQDLIGLRVDGVTRRLHFIPHLPPSWDKVSLRRVRVGDSRVALDLAQSPGETTLHLRNDGAPIKVSFEPELPLGAKVQNARMDQREIEATLVQHPQDAHARLEFDLPRGETTVRIGYTGGVSIVPPTPHPTIGAASRTMKIVGVSLNDRTYTVEFDHRPAEANRFELRTPWKITNVTGAAFQSSGPSSYDFIVKDPPDSEKSTYRRSRVAVTFAAD